MPQDSCDKRTVLFQIQRNKFQGLAFVSLFSFKHRSDHWHYNLSDISWVKQLTFFFIRKIIIFLVLLKSVDQIGFYHMHSAYDRDEYVKIVWDNITPGTEHNFDKYSNAEITYFNTIYDNYSVMHWSDAFSKNGNTTIVPTVSWIITFISEILFEFLFEFLSEWWNIQKCDRNASRLERIRHFEFKSYVWMRWWHWSIPRTISNTLLELN